MSKSYHGCSPGFKEAIEQQAADSVTEHLSQIKHEEEAQVQVCFPRARSSKFFGNTKSKLCNKKTNVLFAGTPSWFVVVYIFGTTQEKCMRHLVNLDVLYIHLRELFETILLL